MEQFKDVHYEIQCENSEEGWDELLDERPKSEEEIPERCDRARARHPGAKIRAVKVSMSVTVERLSEERRTGDPGLGNGGSHQGKIFELLQDSD